jgi:hypothetical protein
VKRLLIVFALGLSLTARAEPPAPAEKPTETVDEASHRILTTKLFPFCMKSDEAMPPPDKSWCDIGEQASTCPELKEMCARPWTEKSFFSSLFHSARGKVDSDTPGGATDRFDWLPKFSLPGAQLVFWVVVGLLTAVLLMILIRAIRDRRQSVAIPMPEEVAEVGLELPDPGLGEVGRLLAQARREVERDVGRGLMLLYAAILRHLEDRRLIRFDVTTTNREYVRTVRGKTPLDRPMADVVREVERTKFGRLSPSRARFDELYERVSQLLTTAALLLLFVGAASCNGCEPGDSGFDGHAAISDILRTQGIAPSRLAAPIDALSRKDPPVILDSHDLLLDAETLQSLEKAMLKGARIMVLLSPTQWMPAWPHVAVAEDPADLDDPDDNAPLEETAATDGGEADGGELDGGGDAVACTPGAPVVRHETKPGPNIQVTEFFKKSSGLTDDTVGYLPDGNRLFIPLNEHDKPDILLERDGDPFAVRWNTELGELLLVADRRLFANAAMTVPTNARLAVALTRELAGDKKEVSYGALTLAHAAQSPSASLMNAGLLAFMIQMLLVLGIGFASRGLAFGALRDRTQMGRRAFSEHVQALGLQFARVKGSRFAASQYAAYALERFRVRLGHDVDGHDPAAMAGVLALRIGREEKEVRETLDAAETARREPNAPSVPNVDLALIQRLGDYLAALQREA